MLIPSTLLLSPKYQFTYGCMQQSLDPELFHWWKHSAIIGTDMRMSVRAGESAADYLENLEITGFQTPFANPTALLCQEAALVFRCPASCGARSVRMKSEDPDSVELCRLQILGSLYV